MGKTLLCISGAYRPAGITEQALDVVAQEAVRHSWQCARIRLIDKHIHYCRNCRACTQTPGAARGVCVVEDDVSGILAAVDQADALVLATPVNFYEATAVTRAFLERLLPGAYWPWGTWSPKIRSKAGKKRSLLITSSAMPGIMARWFTRSMTTLKDISTGLGARPVGRVYLGPVARHRDDGLSACAAARLTRATQRLLEV